MDFCVLLKFDESDCVYVIWFYLCWNNTSDERTRGGHKTRQCFASLCVRNALGSLFVKSGSFTSLSSFFLIVLNYFV